MTGKQPTFEEVGYYDGFHGEPMASRNLDYWTGYAYGERAKNKALDDEVAREERDNGYRPGVDGGQW